MEKNISYYPTFVTKEVEQDFLQKQLDLWNEIREGNKTWKDMNDFRMSYGYPDTNIDSIRRSFSGMGTYYDKGWIGKDNGFDMSDDSEYSGESSGGSSSITPIASARSVVTTDYVKNITTSERDINIGENGINSEEALLKAHGLDPKDFSLKSSTNILITRDMLGGETKTYRSKVVAVKNNKITNIVDEIAKSLESFNPPARVSKRNKYTSTEDEVKTESTESLLIPLYDLHWGRIEDTENYKGFNVETEKNRIIEHVMQYIKKFKNRRFKSVYLILGQDFLNSSFTGYTSSQSHLQDNALDYRTMLRTGSELLIEIIDIFKSITNNLNVIGSLGNHDVSEEAALFMLLNAYYRNDDNVRVDDKLAPRKYLDLGNSCVGLGHVDKEKDRIYGLMQCEAPVLWAKTKTHIFIAGHLHHFEVTSKQGVEVYRVPSICYRDRWTVEQGYVQSEPKTMCFVFDKEVGLTETHFMYL